MNYLKKIYHDVAKGTIQSKQLDVDNVKSIVHRCSFIRNIYLILNNGYLMKDAERLIIEKRNKLSNMEEKIFSEETSGNWYKKHMNLCLQSTK